MLEPLLPGVCVYRHMFKPFGVKINFIHQIKKQLIYKIPGAETVN